MRTTGFRVLRRDVRASGYTEVTQFYHVFIGQQNIGRFEVSVHHLSIFVQVLKTYDVTHTLVAQVDACTMTMATCRPTLSDLSGQTQYVGIVLVWSQCRGPFGNEQAKSATTQWLTAAAQKTTQLT